MSRYRNLMGMSILIGLLISLLSIDAEAAQWTVMKKSGTKADLKGVWGSSDSDV